MRFEGNEFGFYGVGSGKNIHIELAFSICDSAAGNFRSAVADEGNRSIFKRLLAGFFDNRSGDFNFFPFWILCKGGSGKQSKVRKETGRIFHVIISFGLLKAKISLGLNSGSQSYVK